MSLTQKTVSAGISRIASLVIKGVLQLFVLIFFAHYLSKAAFGVISIVTSLLMFVTLFTEIGLGPALIQRLDISKKHIEVAALSSVLMALFMYMLLFFAAPIIAAFYKEEVLESVIKLVGISFVFTSIGSISFSLLRKELDFNAILVVEVVGFIVSYGMVGVTMALMGMGVWAYATSIVVQSGVMTVLLLWKKPITFSLKWHKDEFQHLFGFAGWLTVENIVNTIARQGDVFVIGRTLGMSILGLYGRAYQLVDIPNQYIGMGLDNVLFPALAKKQDDKKSVVQSFLKGVSVSNLFMFPLAAYLFMFAEPIICVVFGTQWIGAAPAMQLLCIALPFKTTVKIVDSLVRALGAFRRSALSKLIYMAGMVGFTLVGSKWGLKGVAIGVNLAVLFNFVVMTVLARRLVLFEWASYFKTYYPGLLLSGLIAVGNVVALQLFSYLHLTPIWVLGIGTVVAAFMAGALLTLYPSVFGKNWEWLFAQMVNRLPNHNRLANVKTFLLRRAVYER